MAAATIAIPVRCELSGEEHEVRAPAWPSVNQLERLIYEQHHSKLPAGVTAAQIKVFGPSGASYAGRRDLPRNLSGRLTYCIVQAIPRDQYEAVKLDDVSHEHERLKQDVDNVFLVQKFFDDGDAPEGRESFNALLAVAAATHLEGREEERANRKIFVRHSNSAEAQELWVPHSATVVDIEMQVFKKVLHEPEGIEAGQIILFTDVGGGEFPSPFTPPVGDKFVYHVLAADVFDFIDDWEGMPVSADLKVVQNLMIILESEMLEVTGYTPAWRELVLTMQAYLKVADERMREEPGRIALGRKKDSELNSCVIKALENITALSGRRRRRKRRSARACDGSSSATS